MCKVDLHTHLLSSRSVSAVRCLHKRAFVPYYIQNVIMTCKTCTSGYEYCCFRVYYIFFALSSSCNCLHMYNGWMACSGCLHRPCTISPHLSCQVVTACAMCYSWGCSSHTHILVCLSLTAVLSRPMLCSGCFCCAVSSPFKFPMKSMNTWQVIAGFHHTYAGETYWLMLSFSLPGVKVSA